MYNIYGCFKAINIDYITTIIIPFNRKCYISINVLIFDPTELLCIENFH